MTLLDVYSMDVLVREAGLRGELKKNYWSSWIKLLGGL